MEKLTIIKPTQKSPLIRLDADKGQLIFEGTSSLPNAAEVYTQVIAWIDTHKEQLLWQELQIDFKLDYVNDVTEVYLHYIVTRLDELHHTEFTAEINWHFVQHNEAIAHLGENLAEYTELEFKFVSKI